MKPGIPLLLSGENITPISRLPIRNVGPDNILECYLQEIIDRHPGVLPIDDFCPGAKGVFSLGREIPVDVGGAPGFVDNLLITNDGHLIVVETKLWRNSEATRSVFAQILQYGMAISQVSLIEFEDRLRKGSAKGRRLEGDQTVAQFVQSQALCDSGTDIDDDFDEVFDRLRRAGEILLLIVADCVRNSVERLVEWMNTVVGTAPYKLGVVELSLYELPDVGRIVVPKTLLRIREGSRHVVTINIENSYQGQLTTRVAGPDAAPTAKKLTLPAVPLTEEKLLALIRSRNSPENIETAAQLLERLKTSGLDSRGTAAWIQYGVQVEGDFLGLVELSGTEVYCYLRKRAIVALGDNEFVKCKQKICSVAEFYRSFEADDPTKLKYCVQHYEDLTDKVEQFVSTIREIGDKIRTALTN